MKTFKTIPIALLFLLAINSFFACKDQVKKKEMDKKEKTQAKEQAAKKTPEKLEENHTLLADSITYGVIIKATPKTNKEFIKNLNKQKFVDLIFDAVNTEKINAYDYYTNEKLNKDDIEEIISQDDFSKEAIGRVLFTEKWMLDTTNIQMTKQVHSLIFGYELLRSDGELKGYKPIFKVVLN